MEFRGNEIWETPEQTFFAQGGNSHVYRVTNKLSEGEFALKLYKFENSTGERFNRFLDEIDVVKSLREISGCVSCIDHGLFDERPFYVMKYYRGGTFRDKYIGTQAHTLDEKIEDFSRTLEIVRCGHAIGLAIRDIKPQNILIDEDGAPVVSDFGLSMWIDMPDEARNTPPLGMIGSQGYRPPEWQTRYPDPNHQPGDIWSLGRLFWAILAGRNAPNSYETLGGKGTHLNLYITNKHSLRL